MSKIPSDTGRQGHERGQVIADLAALHGVPEEFLELIGYGSIDDLQFVEALRIAAHKPGLWELVSPAAKEALLLPEFKIGQLSGTRDDLLKMLSDTIACLQHPANRNFARSTTAIQYVDQSLDWLLEDQARGRVETLEQRQRATLDNARKAAEIGGAKKRLESRAQAWVLEVQSRRPGVSKEQKYGEIERRVGLSPGSVKKAVLRLSKRIDEQAVVSPKGEDDE